MMEIKRQVGRFLRKQGVQHALFWGLSFFALLKFFGREYGAPFSAQTVIYTALFHLSLLVVVYGNLGVLIPRLLEHGRYLLYLLGLGALVGVGTELNAFTFNHLSDLLFPGYFFISYYEWRELVLFMGVYAVLSTLLKMSKAWFELSEKEQLIGRLEKQKVEAELAALRGQVNPHFFFNSLNNLYALALERDPRTPEVVLLLSRCMRYMLHEAAERVVPLERELDYLRDYFQLQRLRHPSEAELQFEVEGETDGREVAPLLFIPFVENAFKHGAKGRNAFLRARLQVRPRSLVFSVSNTKKHGQEELPPEPSGTGLENVRRRLELLYPGRHRLRIEEDARHYSVLLEIEDLKPA